MPKAEFDDKLHYRITWELRCGHEVLNKGETAGGKDWLTNKFAAQNALKRAKWSAGINHREKTTAGKGDGDIVRIFEDGNTFHIWVHKGANIPDAKQSAKTSAITYSQEIEDKLFNDGACDVIGGLDFKIVATRIHDAISAYDVDEPLSVETVRDVLSERVDDINDMFS